jgi:hypothetical protein
VYPSSLLSYTVPATLAEIRTINGAIILIKFDIFLYFGAYYTV